MSSSTIPARAALATLHVCGLIRNGGVSEGKEKDGDRKREYKKTRVIKKFKLLGAKGIKWGDSHN